MIAKGHSFDHWPQRSRVGYTAVPISEWNGSTFVPRPDLGIEKMLPGIALSENHLMAYKLVKPLEFKGAAVYIGGQIHNDHQFLPVGLFAAHNLDSDNTDVQSLHLGGQDLERQPWDIGKVWADFLDEKYVGVGWYRLDVEIPPMANGDALALHFGGVDEHAWVWVNGHYAGQHDIGPRDWNKPFQLDVSQLLKPGKANQITVRVMNTAVNGGIWRPIEVRAYRKH